MPGRLGEFWNGMSPGQQRVLGIIALTTVILGAGMWALTTKGGGEYVSLYSGLSGGDTAEITQQLAKMGVPYKAGSQPGTLMVPGTVLAKTRMELAAQGLPQSGMIGFEIFDKSPLMTTDFMQRMNYLRALQGELSRSIASLDPVSSARVHVTMPQPSIFRQETQQATASVVLGLKPGQSLSSSQARGIGFLVSRAVEGLKPENIFIIDSKGKVLWTGSDGSDAESDQEAAKAQVEHDVERRVQSMLDHALGVGKAVVRVSAEVSLQRREVESETYLPAEKGKGVVLSETENTEQYRAPGGGVLPPMGAAGAATNLHTAPMAGGLTGIGSNAYTKQQITSQYEISKRSEKLVDPPGTLKRLSVAVLADQGKEANRLLALRGAIASAAGIDQRRGDSLVVTPVEFQKSPVPKQGMPGETLELIKTITRFVLILIAMVGGIMLLKVFAGALRSSPTEFTPSEAESAMLAQGEEIRRLAAGSKKQAEEKRRATEQQFLSARDLAQEKPEEAAEVVKLWLEEQ